MAQAREPVELPETVGLLCGAGRLPVVIAQTLAARGVRLVAACFTGEVDPALDGVVDEIHRTGVAKLGLWVRIFRAAGAGAVMMAGGVRKEQMFDNKVLMIPDWRTVKMWYGQLTSREDHTILGAVADEFEKEGMPVRSVAECCPELVAREGCLTRRRPRSREWRDIRFAWPIAKQVAALQIGQSIVVRDRAVIAVEGIDGTDALIERGGRLAGAGAVVVKVARADHDERFDMPCVGPRTVERLAQASVRVMAIEAGRTVMLDERETGRAADAAGVCLVAVAWPADGPPAG
jgi:DUF1009 family protein